MDILTEIYQFLFALSIIFMVYIIGDLAIKMYGRFKLKADTHFILGRFEKVALWISLAIIFTFIL